MKLRVNRWTLEMEGAKLPPKYYYQQLHHAKIAMKAMTCIVFAMVIYNLIYTISWPVSNSISFRQRILMSIAGDVGSLIVMLIFYILLPYKGISFPGMGAIPMCVLVALEVQVNSYAYKDYDDVSGLYQRNVITAE